MMMKDLNQKLSIGKIFTKECPECKNIIELDWSGDLYDDENDGCSGHCCGCSGCGDIEEDEEDDM